MLFSLAASAEPPARVFTWAGAVEQLPALSQYAPLLDAKALPKTLFARVGGRCFPARRAIPLGEGSRDGHTWRWEMTIDLAPDATTVEGPIAIHGLDRVGDGRTTERRTRPRCPTFRQEIAPEWCREQGQMSNANGIGLSK